MFPRSSFLASINPGASANFSCSSRKSSGVVFSFKTLTSFFRPTISLLRIIRSSSASFSRCLSFSSYLSDSVITSCPLFILPKSSETSSTGPKESEFVRVESGEILSFRQKERILWSVQDPACSSCFCLPSLPSSCLAFSLYSSGKASLMVAFCHISIQSFITIS